jgi:nucleotide-binding universal stress UspA family protein
MWIIVDDGTGRAMVKSDVHLGQPLMLDSVVLDRRVARKLPANLAFNYHVLPVAEDKDHVTVAMANPENARACEAVTAVLGKQTYIVKSDAKVIDRLLKELWANADHNPLNVLSCPVDISPPAGVQNYIDYIGLVLQADIYTFPLNGLNSGEFDRFVEEANEKFEMVMLYEADSTLIQRLLLGSHKYEAVKVMKTSFMIVQHPRWPLKKILLVHGGDEGDDAALDWAIRLAKGSRALITVLSIVPGVPAMYDGMKGMTINLSQVLVTECSLGKQLRRVAKSLVDHETEGTLKLRQGSFRWQVEEELVEGDYDLIVVAAGDKGWFQKIVLGELVDAVIGIANQPVFVAKPYN